MTVIAEFDKNENREARKRYHVEVYSGSGRRWLFSSGRRWRWTAVNNAKALHSFGLDSYRVVDTKAGTK